MALVKLQPTSGLVGNTPTLPEVLAKPNESTFTPLYPESKVNTLLKYVEGYPWTVHYYGQLVNSGDTLEHVDPGTPRLNQPYYEVLDAILQVSSPLSSSYDAASGVTTVTGSALVPFRLVPNVGDIFVAQVDSGEDAVFIITSVLRKTHRKDTLYDVEYSLYQYTSVNPDLMVQIKLKVQDSYHFNKDSLNYNRDNLISPMEHKARLDLGVLLRESQSYYFDRFISKPAGTILLPGVPDRVYDPYLMAFLSKTTSHDVLPGTGMYKHTQHDRYAKQPVFWDMLLTRSMSLIRTVNRRVGFIGSHAVRNRARYGTAFHSGLDYVAAPMQPNADADIGVFARENATEWFNFTNAVNGEVFETYAKTVNNGTALEMPVLPALFVDSHYVVSPAFYAYCDDRANIAQLTYIELLLHRFLVRDAIPKEDVVAALATYDRWSVTHQLYMLPALWQIAKALS